MYSLDVLKRMNEEAVRNYMKQREEHLRTVIKEIPMALVPLSIVSAPSSEPT